jgi:uncharacterized protein (TIGR01244 family)
VRVVVRAIAFGIVGVVLATAAAWGQVTTETLAGVTNLRQVKSTVACAGATTPEAMRGIKDMGFASVVNLRQASETGANIEASSAAAATAGLKYIHLPLNGAAPDAAVFDQFIAVARLPMNQPMFVHCGGGNRAAAAWLAKRLVVDGWTVERAAEEAEALGLRSGPLKQFVLDYAKAHQGK